MIPPRTRPLFVSELKTPIIVHFPLLSLSLSPLAERDPREQRVERTYICVWGAPSCESHQLRLGGGDAVGQRGQPLLPHPVDLPPQPRLFRPLRPLLGFRRPLLRLAGETYDVATRVGVFVGRAHARLVPRPPAPRASQKRIVRLSEVGLALAALVLDVCPSLLLLPLLDLK